MVSPRSSIFTKFGRTKVRTMMPPESVKSCDSTSRCSSKSSATLLYGRKPPVVHQQRQPTMIPPSREVRQRVQSARRLRAITFQNQLAEAQQTISNLYSENRVLRSVHKRQDLALAKYEASNADLPKLINSHAEELRVWQTKCRNLTAANKDLEQKLKHKDKIINTLRDQNDYFNQLNKNKKLDDRQKLTLKVQELEGLLVEKDNDIRLMARRLQLESKSHKQHMETAQKKSNDALAKLGRGQLDGLSLSTDKLSSKLTADLRRNRPFNTKNEPTLQRDLEKFLEVDFKSLLADGGNNFADADVLSTVTEEEEEKTSTPSARSYTIPKQSIDLGGSRNKTICKINEANMAPTPTTRLSKSDIRRLSSPRPRQLALTAKRQPQVAPRVPLAAPRKQQQQQKRIEKDQGEGDGPHKNDAKKTTVTDKKQQLLNQLSNCTSVTSVEYEDDYEQSSQDDGADNNKEKSVSSDIDNKVDEARLGAGDSLNLVEWKDSDANDIVEELGTNDELDDYEDGNDDEDLEYYLKAAEEAAFLSNGASALRKKVVKDYKDREAFLNTFCRQTGSVNEVDTPKSATKKQRSTAGISRNNTSSVNNNNNRRKPVLHAAIRAMDDINNRD